MRTKHIFISTALIVALATGFSAWGQVPPPGPPPPPTGGEHGSGGDKPVNGGSAPIDSRNLSSLAVLFVGAFGYAGIKYRQKLKQKNKTS